MSKCGRVGLSTFALLALVLQSSGVFIGHTPSFLAPCSGPAVLAAFWAGGLAGIVVVCVPVVVFGTWAMLAEKWSRVRVMCLLVVALLLAGASLMWFDAMFPSGVRCQGQSYVYTMASASASLFAGAIGLLCAARLKRSVTLELAAVWVICFWAASYAAPYFGELP